MSQPRKNSLELQQEYDRFAQKIQTLQAEFDSKSKLEGQENMQRAQELKLELEQGVSRLDQMRGEIQKLAQEEGRI